MERAYEIRREEQDGRSTVVAEAGTIGRLLEEIERTRGEGP